MTKCKISFNRYIEQSQSILCLSF